MSLTQDRLRELLDYDPETGVFTWRKRSDVPPQWNTRFAGTRAGSDYRKYRVSGREPFLSYRHIRISPQLYLAHRLAWLWMVGSWPGQIDHRDCDGLNNRWVNLRVCTSTQNQGNSRVQRKKVVGLKGVHRTKGNKYYALIRDRGVLVYLGTFDTADAAHAAYCEKAVEVFGEFAREG